MRNGNISFDNMSFVVLHNKDTRGGNDAVIKYVIIKHFCYISPPYLPDAHVYTICFHTLRNASTEEGKLLQWKPSVKRFKAYKV